MCATFHISSTTLKSHLSHLQGGSGSSWVISSAYSLHKPTIIVIGKLTAQSFSCTIHSLHFNKHMYSDCWSNELLPRALSMLAASVHYDDTMERSGLTNLSINWWTLPGEFLCLVCKQGRNHGCLTMVPRVELFQVCFSIYPPGNAMYNIHANWQLKCSLTSRGNRQAPPIH